jgi:tetratricopeptide (TPR) repeat protein
VVYVLWIPFQGPVIRALSAAAERALWLLDHPSLCSGLQTRGNDVVIFSWISGQEWQLAIWNAWDLHLFIVVTLALVLAAPQASLGSKCRQVAAVLGILGLAALLICIVHVKTIMISAAWDSLALTVASTTQYRFLQFVNQTLITLSTLLIPMSVCLIAYLSSLGLGPDDQEAREGWLELRGFLLPAVVLTILVVALAGVNRPSIAEHLAALQWVRQHNPDSSTPDLSLGIFYEGQGRLDEAADAYRAALSGKRDAPAAHFGLGNVLYAKGAVEAAERSYREALRLDPGQVSAKENLGIALVDLGRYEEAAPLFAEVIRANPLHAAAQHNLGLALMRLDRSCEGLPHLERGAALDRRFALDPSVRATIQRLKVECSSRNSSVRLP